MLTSPPVQMILHSKCMAARDMQVGEKLLKKQVAAAEEQQVVAEMEQRRLAGLAEQEVRLVGLGVKCDA